MYTQSQEKTKELIQDNAVEHAKTYWMMGWTWEEIAYVLEDMGFDNDDIDEAIELTQEYAHKVLNNGPFSELKEGQLIKLVNSNKARILSRHKDFINCLIDNEQVSICAEHIDIEASKKLTNAYNLKVEAFELLRKAQEIGNLPPEQPKSQPTDQQKQPAEQPVKEQELVPEEVPQQELEDKSKKDVVKFQNVAHALTTKFYEAQQVYNNMKVSVTDKQLLLKKLQLASETSIEKLSWIINYEDDFFNISQKSLQRLNTVLETVNKTLMKKSIPEFMHESFNDLYSFTERKLSDVINISFNNLDLLSQSNRELSKMFSNENDAPTIISGIDTLMENIRQLVNAIEEHLPSLDMISKRMRMFNEDMAKAAATRDISNAIQTLKMTI